MRKSNSIAIVLIVVLSGMFLISSPYPDLPKRTSAASLAVKLTVNATFNAALESQRSENSDNAYAQIVAIATPLGRDTGDHSGADLGLITDVLLESEHYWNLGRIDDFARIRWEWGDPATDTGSWHGLSNYSIEFRDSFSVFGNRSGGWSWTDFASANLHIRVEYVLTGLTDNIALNIDQVNFKVEYSTNTAPVIDNKITTLRVIKQHQGFFYMFSGSDAEGDALTWSISGPSWLQIDAEDGGTSGSTMQLGTHSFIVTLSDGSLTDTNSFDILVIEVDKDARDGLSELSFKCNEKLIDKLECHITNFPPGITTKNSVFTWYIGNRSVLTSNETFVYLHIGFDPLIGSVDVTLKIEDSEIDSYDGYTGSTRKVFVGSWLVLLIFIIIIISIIAIATKQGKKQKGGRLMARGQS